jgi:hypothetical protein
MAGRNWFRSAVPWSLSRNHATTVISTTASIERLPPPTETLLCHPEHPARRQPILGHRMHRNLHLELAPSPDIRLGGPAGINAYGENSRKFDLNVPPGLATARRASVDDLIDPS